MLARGRRAALVMPPLLSRTPVTEFGQLLAAWDYRSENMDARQIARAWARCNAPAGQEEFEPLATADKTKPLPLKFFRKFDLADLPKRQWLVGKYVARNYYTSLIAPPVRQIVRQIEK